MELLRFLLKDGKEWFHWETDMDRLLAYIMKCGGEEIVMSTKYVNCTSGQLVLQEHGQKSQLLATLPRGLLGS